MAGLAYKVDDESVTSASVTTYTFPNATNGVGIATMQAINGDLQLYETSAGTGDYYTIKENASLSLNLRYLEGKSFYFKSASGTVRLEVLYFEGLGT